jgi:UDP-N-acetylglucosamine transferase subunit ALG13
MIFLTVGAQMPFDRLVRRVDSWAAMRGRNDLFAQIGNTALRPAHVEWTHFLDPLDYRRRLAEADVIVTHAGMGTILTALEFGRPILVLPRRADLRETRTDHQLGTAHALAEAHRISVAWNDDELLHSLDQLDQLPAPRRVTSCASLPLLTALRAFIRGDAESPARVSTTQEDRFKHPAGLRGDTGKKAA